MSELTASGVRHRWLFGLNALLAWLGLAVALLLTLLGTYPNTNTVPTLLGFNRPGAEGVIGRTLDYFSYFTIWSNILVAIVATLLLVNPLRRSGIFRVLRMDSLIMITVTGLIFAIILAPDAQLQGWQHLSNTLEHYITPVLTVLVFLLLGPRGLFRISTVFLALVIPFIWVAYTLVRGAVIDAYPYGFIDVAAHGYGTVTVNLIGIVVFGIILGLIYLGLDRLFSRGAHA